MRERADDAQPTDTTVRPGKAHVAAVARLAAEPRLLARWSHDAGDARLADAYRALAERVGARADDLLRCTVDKDPDPERLAAEITAAAAAHHAEMLDVTAELSRLKWLLAGRRGRLQTEALPGHARHREAEEDEAETLERLMHELMMRIC